FSKLNTKILIIVYIICSLFASRRSSTSYVVAKEVGLLKAVRSALCVLRSKAPIIKLKIL
ncbi:hypothetical protein, partial [Brachyspira hyodysenteriae]|uniref:hypothetical protein n=1 Tax=Brachyspira hyodysenteriae TaxID=159 RepID=UPI0019552E00